MTVHEHEIADARHQIAVIDAEIAACERSVMRLQQELIARLHQKTQYDVDAIALLLAIIHAMEDAMHAMAEHIAEFEGYRVPRLPAQPEYQH